tara:strand:- start:32 stop:661 length:630 start_codon:yes stop_codon:yes gene_type:complete
MSQLKLTADGGGGTVSLKGPSSTTGNAAIELTVPGTGSATVDTLGRAGNILQVKQTVKTSFFSTTTTGSLVDVTGVSVTITPSSSSSKILVSCLGEYGNGNNDSFAHLNLARVLDGSTDSAIAVGDARGSTGRVTMNASLRSGGGLSHNISRSFGCEFLDSPNTTNAIIYKLRIYVVQGTPACIGGTDSTGSAGYASAPTFITAKEVAA